MRIHSDTAASAAKLLPADVAKSDKPTALLFSAPGKGSLISRIFTKIQNFVLGVRGAAAHVEQARPRRAGFSPGRDWDHAASARRALARQISDASPNGLPKQFSEVWQDRETNKAMFSLFCGFASHCKFRENVDFLAAVDELRAAPSASKAEQLLETFITAAPVDDFGIPVNTPGKKQINLASDTARNALVKELRVAITDARSGRDADAMKKIVALLAPVEVSVAASMSRNINNMLSTELAGAGSGANA